MPFMSALLKNKEIAQHRRLQKLKKRVMPPGGAMC